MTTFTSRGDRNGVIRRTHVDRRRRREPRRLRSARPV